MGSGFSVPEAIVVWSEIRKVRGCTYSLEESAK